MLTCAVQTCAVQTSAVVCTDPQNESGPAPGTKIVDLFQWDHICHRDPAHVLSRKDGATYFGLEAQHFMKGPKHKKGSRYPPSKNIKLIGFRPLFLGRGPLHERTNEKNKTALLNIGLLSVAVAAAPLLRRP